MTRGFTTLAALAILWAVIAAAPASADPATTAARLDTLLGNPATLSRSAVTAMELRAQIDRAMGRLEARERLEDSLRDARRLSDERWLDRRGSLGALETYRQREERRDDTAYLARDLDRRLAEVQTGQPVPVAIELRREIERALDRAEFQRRTHSLGTRIRARQQRDGRHGVRSRHTGFRSRVGSGFRSGVRGSVRR